MGKTFFLFFVSFFQKEKKEAKNFKEDISIIFMMDSILVRYKKLLLLVLVLLGLALRLSFLPYGAFNDDEIRDFYRIYKMSTGEEFQVLGTEIGIGRLPSSFYYFLITIPLLFVKSIYASTTLLALLNSLSILLVYKIAKEMFDEIVGIYSSILYTFSPWMIYNSISMWNPYYLIFFSLLFIFFLYRFVEKEDSKYLVLVIPLIGIMFAFHLISLYAFIFVFLVFITYRSKINIRYLLIGILILVALYIPYLIYELTNDFENIKKVLDRAQNTSFRVETFKYFLWLFVIFSSEISHIIGRGSKTILEFYNFFSIEFVLLMLFNVFSLLVIVFSYFDYVKTIVCQIKQRSNFMKWFKEKKAYSFIILWILSSFLFLIITKSPGEPRYMVVIYPLGFMLIGLLIRKLIEKYRSKELLINILIIVFVLSQVYLSFKLYSYFDEKGSGYKFREIVINKVLEVSGERRFHILDANEFNPYEILFKTVYKKYFSRWISKKDLREGDLIYFPVSIYEYDRSKELQNRYGSFKRIKVDKLYIIEVTPLNVVNNR